MLLCNSAFLVTHFLQKEICQGYKNCNWISLQKPGNVHTLGEIWGKTTAAYSSLAWIVSNTH